MKKTFTIKGADIEFTTCTAVSSDFPEYGRRDALYCHDVSDTFRNGDGIYFNEDMPESADDAELLLLNGYLDTYYETLNTVEFG